jgi:hypothetical protein
MIESLATQAGHTESGCSPGCSRSHQKQLASGGVSCAISDRLAEWSWRSFCSMSRSPRGSVVFLRADGESLALARHESVCAVGPGVGAGVAACGAEKARQPTTEFFRGEGLLDHRVAARVRAACLVGSLDARQRASPEGPSAAWSTLWPWSRRARRSGMRCWGLSSTRSTREPRVRAGYRGTSGDLSPRDGSDTREAREGTALINPAGPRTVRRTRRRLLSKVQRDSIGEGQSGESLAEAAPFGSSASLGSSTSVSIAGAANPIAQYT